MASKSQRQAPLSQHPLFPAMVALWFAALLGLGSLSIRTSVLEQMVRAVHLDLLVPSAAPPLGFTAQLLLALLLSFGGGLLGYVLARRMAVAPARRERAPARIIVPEPSAAPVQPDDQANDAADDGEDLARLDAARAAQPRRRRALTAEDNMAEPAPLEFAPLPDRIPPMLTLGDLDSLPPLGPHVPAASPVPAGPFAGAEPDTAADFGASPATPAIRPKPAAPPALAPLPLAASARIDASAADRLRSTPLETLGTVELVERFALALAARRARAAANESDRPFDLPPGLHARTTGRFGEPGGGAFAPAFGRPNVAFPGKEPDDEALSDPGFSSLLDMKPPTRAALHGEGVSAAPDAAEPGMRLSGQPAAASPIGAFRSPLAANASDPAETERELRDALAALQRMSGAA